ncbi:MAG TPA: metallophosphoesterase [Gemmatimonadaceae bacterium]|nr:metallophosphoesterase [Gemmatimonadaceae bacterium]
MAFAFIKSGFRVSLVVVFAGVACTNGGPTPPISTTQTLTAVGDVASCTSQGDEATAALVDGIPGTIILAGDIAYESGTAKEFGDCYDPSWGRHRARTRPAPGNREYETPGAIPYYAYFGANAGPPGRGYYSFDLGDWHIVSLNSNVSAAAGSAQEQWLRADLAASDAHCTLAYWHHPMFSSGLHGSQAVMRDIFRVLYEFNADVVIAAHDHHYERFAPQTVDGAADPARGIREFVVGTGGHSLYPAIFARANSERRYSSGYGVLRLELESEGYRWEFVPVTAGVTVDSGTGVCH